MRALYTLFLQGYQSRIFSCNIGGDLDALALKGGLVGTRVPQAPPWIRPIEREASTKQNQGIDGDGEWRFRGGGYRP